MEEWLVLLALAAYLIRVLRNRRSREQQEEPTNHGTTMVVLGGKRKEEPRSGEGVTFGDFGNIPIRETDVN